MFQAQNKDQEAVAADAHAIGTELEALYLREKREGTERAGIHAVKQLGAMGLLEHVVPQAYGGRAKWLQVGSLCAAREAIAYHSGLADAMFALQGLGSGPLTLFGTEAQKQRWLPRVGRGEAVAAFALTEPNAGSDVAGIETVAQPSGKGWRLTGLKRFISNAPIFDFAVVFARTGDGSHGITAFLVETFGANGLTTFSTELIAPHPIGEVRLERLELPAEAVIGKVGEGMKVALATLDVFRPTVGAAAVGLARRAFDEAVKHVQSRKQFEKPLSEQQGVQWMIADCAAELQAARLLVYQAAAAKDGGAERITLEAAMAKYAATEAAQRVVDRCLQLHGGLGVVAGSWPERLYREVRALRIYEGSSEIQKLVIAREIFKGANPWR
jgi:acyl-CoA dehydrogenase